MRGFQRWFAVAAGFLLLALALTQPRAAQAADPAGGELVVFAAASMKDALDAAIAAWPGREGVDVKPVYAASSVVARQIEQGAPAGLFISASTQWMDYVAERDLIVAESRTDLVGNTLVVVAPAAASAPLPVLTAGALSARLGDGRLAIGDPAHVPAGIYAREALKATGIWDAVADRLAPAENVRAALAFVARSEAPLGIVYGSDAAADKGVAVVATFPSGSHASIVYPAAVVKGAPAAATALLDFLKTDAASAIFQAHGFLPSPATAP